MEQKTIIKEENDMPDWPPIPDSTKIECLKGNHELPFRPKEQFGLGDGTPPYMIFECVHCKKKIYKHGDREISAKEYNDAYKKY
jgi:hypothetical protein